MSEEIKVSTYYKDNIPALIKRLKNSLDKIAPIIDQDIDKEIKDDKLLNVLKAKRQASEDYVWTIKKIDELENELNGIDINALKESEEEKTKVTVHPSKQHSRQ